MEEIATWMTTREVSEILGVSSARAVDFIEAGHIEAVRTRLGWLSRPSSVVAFAARRAAMPRRGSGYVTPPLPEHERVSA